MTDAEGEEDKLLAECSTIVQRKCCSNECNKLFSAKEFAGHKTKLQGASKLVQDAFIVGMMAASRRRGVREPVSRSSKRGKLVDQGFSSGYYLHGKKMCRSLFCEINDIADSCGGRLARLQSTCDFIGDYDVDLDLESLLQHKKKNRASNNVKADLHRVVVLCKFMQSYAEQHGLPDPGRYSRTLGSVSASRVFLPQGLTVSEVYQKYKRTLEANHMTSSLLKLTLFRSSWLQFCPHISILTPRSDMCAACVNYRETLQGAKSFEEEESVLREWVDHKNEAYEERSLYKKNGELGKKPVFWTEVGGVVETLVLSFDYAQQILIPQYPDQVGDLYFRAGRKIQMFGISDDGNRIHTSYLVDESSTIGKGSNSVILMLHDYLSSSFSHRITNLKLTCDNCGGQNKNRFMVSYLLWLVARSMFGISKIELHNMVPGHTKFFVDSNFGAAKIMIKRHGAGSIVRLKELCEKSMSGGKHVVKLASDPVSGESLVQFFDWKDLSSRCKTVSNIRAFRHFRFSQGAPGCMEVRKNLRDSWRKVNLLKSSDTENAEFKGFKEEDLRALKPKGLDNARKKYLAEKIRQFVNQNEICQWKGIRMLARDMTCPLVHERTS